jgi:quercetin dioxygenase-like cupin family protein
MRAVSLACVLVLATTSAVRAQDPAKVDAKHYQVLIDNARTRVFHVVVGPGEKVPMHEHPDAIMIPLTVPPTRKGLQPPAAIFMPAQKHGGDNPGTTPVDFLYVELKGDGAPTAMVPSSAMVRSNRPGITKTSLVDHAKACAIRVTMDTGSSRPAGAVDDYDQVIVALGDAEVGLVVDGKTTNTWKRGDVAFIGRNVKYEYKNAGKPADFVIVAIK